MQKFSWPIVSTLILLSIIGCTPEVKKSASPSKGDGTSSPIQETLVAVEYGIGDVETSLKMELTIVDDGSLPSVEIEEKETTKHELALVNVKVRKPYPEKLTLNLKLRAFDVFAEHAVKIIPHVFFDDVDVKLEGYVYGGGQTEGLRNIRIEVFDHLKEGATSTLVHVELELSLFLNTDASEIGLETPPTPLTQTNTSFSNPVRIDFLP